jgi:hypothetical protein
LPTKKVGTKRSFLRNLTFNRVDLGFKKNNILSYFIHLFTCAYIVWVISHLYPPLSPPYPLASRQSLFWAFLQFLWRVEIINNKKDIMILLIDIRTAIQRDSYHCFHVQMCYNPCWFISNWSLYWFLIPFSRWPLSL